MSRPLLVAAVSALIALGLAVWRPAAFFHGYLAAFVLWWGLPLGAAALLMLHHLVGGRWGWSIRPHSEAVVGAAPLLPLLFLPLLPGLGDLYAWTDPAVVEQTPVLQLKDGYLNVPFFLGRAAVFFAVWIVGGWLLVRGSRRADRMKIAGDLETQHAPAGLRQFACIGLIGWALTASFAGIDWIGSLQAVWYSSVFGLYVLMGQVLTALATMILAVGVLPRRGSASGVVPLDADVLNDLGNLLLTAVVLHAYMAFSQFFLIWNGNLPHEIIWYVPRTRGLWGGVSAALIVLHFFVPLAALLFRRIKRDPRLLAAVAGLILVMRIVEALWMVMPASGLPLGPQLLSAAAVGVAMGALLLIVIRGQWRRGVLRGPRAAGREGGEVAHG